MVDLVAFNKWLDRAMEQAGIESRAELARRMDRSDATMYRWLKGARTPGFDDLQLMARELGVSRFDLYRAMGLLPPIADEDRERVIELLGELSAAETWDVLEFARYRIQRRLDAQRQHEEEIARHPEPRSG